VGTGGGVSSLFTVAEEAGRDRSNHRSPYGSETSEQAAVSSLLSAAGIDGRRAVVNCNSLPHNRLRVSTGADRILVIPSVFYLTHNYCRRIMLLQLNRES